MCIVCDFEYIWCSWNYYAVTRSIFTLGFVIMKI